MNKGLSIKLFAKLLSLSFFIFSISTPVKAYLGSGGTVSPLPYNPFNLSQIVNWTLV